MARKKINNKTDVSTVSNKTEPKKKNNTSVRDDDGPVVLDFTNCTLKGYQHKDYTNFCSSESEFAELITTIIVKGTSLLSKYKKSDILCKKHNSHPVSDDKIPLVINYLKDSLSWSDDMIDNEGIGGARRLYYLSLESTSIRIVGWFDNDMPIFRVCMIDYFHLMHPSPKYNQRDYKKNKFCPIGNYSVSL